MSTAIDEQQMLLIMKFYDGECSEVEVLQAERLLRESEEAGFVLSKFSSLGGLVEEWGHTVQSRTTWVPDVDVMMEEVDFRRTSSARPVSVSELENQSQGSCEIRSAGIVSDRKFTSGQSFLGRLLEKKEPRGRRYEAGIPRGVDFWHGLGWASSGALVAASLVLLFGISGNLSYFNRNVGGIGASSVQTAGVKVVSGEELITGGDQGSAGASFVNGPETTSRIAQPLVRQWDRNGEGSSNFEELREIRNEKDPRKDEKKSLLGERAE
jgi:hypothetical protein